MRCNACDKVIESVKFTLYGYCVCESCFAKRTAFNDNLTTNNDKINHPSHYTKGIECWDYIVSHELGYLAGNCIKYLTRYKHKNGVEDLKKADAYLKKLIEVESEAEND